MTDTPDINNEENLKGSAKYTAEDIQVLGGREAVRKRPGM
jgi:hypothetical protein